MMRPGRVIGLIVVVAVGLFVLLMWQNDRFTEACEAEGGTAIHGACLRTERVEL